MKSDVVTLTVDMRFPADRLDQALQLLISVSDRIGAKNGCEESLIARDSIEENRVRYSETWSLDDAFKRHLRSEEFRRVLFALDMCSEEPGVAIGNFSGQTGLLNLQQLCAQQAAADPAIDAPKET